MPNFPSLPPDRHSPDPDPAETGRVALRAVLTGVSIDICASKLLGIVIVTLYALQVGTPGMTAEQIDDALQKMSPQLPLVLLGGVLGALISVAAGYACARIARRGEYRIGAIMAMVSVFVSQIVDGGAPTADLALLYGLCDMACTMLGVKYGAEHNRRLEAPASSPADAPVP